MDGVTGKPHDAGEMGHSSGWNESLGSCIEVKHDLDGAVMQLSGHG